MRKLGIAVSYIISIMYILLLLMPAFYCIQHECRGPDLDGFMPAVLFIPVGGIATAYSLRHAVRKIRRGGSWSWLFWSLAAIFVLVLAAIALFVAIMIYMTAFHH
ncbi:MAG TPA: hypothetical protein VHX61_00480 [Rhizomicrobium sp.]|nr:hypothetical protein [Rhizomicrobium sp.]